MSAKKFLVWSIVTLVMLVAVVATGAAIAGRSSRASDGGVSATASVSGGAPTLAPAPADNGIANTSASYGTAASTEQAASASPADAPGANTGRLMVETAALELRVKDIQATVTALRTAAARLGGSVSDVAVTFGDSSVEPPAAGLSAESARTSGLPAGGTVTIRVPADKLDALTATAAGLGTVISQTSSAADVTQQHVDLAARLKNLRAEEARVRALFSRAGGVTALLEVERELSRVRGDIEAMQAELDSLNNQISLATLTVTLTQPGAVVRPSVAGSWGFSAAVTLGVQSAAALLRALITGAIALAPLALLAMLGWVALRIRRSFTRRRTAPSPDDA